MAVYARTLLGEHERKSGAVAWMHRIIVLLLYLFTLTTLFPLVWLVGTAFKSSDETLNHPLRFLPTDRKPVAIAQADNSGMGQILGINVVDEEQMTDHSYRIEFTDSDRVDVTDLSNGEVVLAGKNAGDQDLAFAGLNVPLRGQFNAGDSFTVEMRLWQTQNYAEAWDGVNFIRHSLNSFILMIMTLALHLGVNAVGAYALSRLRFPGSKLIMFLFLMTLMVPWYAIFIPLYLTVTELGLTVPMYGWPAVVLPAGFNAFFLILFKSFFDGLPSDLIDAGRVDGASEIQTFWHIAVPLAKPIFGVITVFSLLATWNDFLWPYLVIGVERAEPIMVRLYNYELTGTATNEQVLAAMAMAMLPPLVLFLIFQKQIAAGFTLSGLKG